MGGQGDPPDPGALRRDGDVGQLAALLPRSYEDRASDVGASHVSALPFVTDGKANEGKDIQQRVRTVNEEQGASPASFVSAGDGDGEDVEMEDHDYGAVSAVEHKPGVNAAAKQEGVNDKPAKAMPFPTLFDEFISRVKNKTKNRDEVSEDDRQLMQEMFTMVFKLHGAGDLPESKEHYPDLLLHEMDELLELFWLEVLQQGATSQQWKNRLRDLTKSIYGTRRSLLDTIELRVNSLKARPAASNNSWQTNPLKTPEPEQQNEAGSEAEDHNTIVRFRADVYSPDEIAEMRAAYVVEYSFPKELREPTELEIKITQGLLEGNILAQGLPQFLKRSCDNDLLRVIQNTIFVQVEGELFFQLPPNFPVYPDFQTRERLVGAILRGAKRCGYDSDKLTEMLGESKQVCYNAQQHSVHLFFWTREAASKWTKTFRSIPFRSRKFLLINARPADDCPNDSVSQRRSKMWARQTGVDGVRNEQRHERYKVKLLNVSRFMDEATLDAFIRSKFDGSYITFQEPRNGHQMFQTGVWEIFFRSPGCPPFLERVRFINWMGTKILVHHVGVNPAPPCYNCGISGHTVAQCKMQPEDWSLRAHCIKVSTGDLDHVVRHKATVTSFAELKRMWSSRSEPKRPPTAEIRSDTSAPISKLQTAQRDQTATQGGDTDWKSPSRKKTFRPEKSARDLFDETKIKNSNEPPTQQQDTNVVDLVSEASSEEEMDGPADVTPPKRTFLPRPAALSKQNRLILDLMKNNQQNPNSDQTKLIRETEIDSLGALTGFEVLKHCGLSPVETPRTGNCQYYAVAMALLNMTFVENEAARTIENMTSKLKKGIKIAALHDFEAEFSHGVRQALLSNIVNRAGQLTIAESEERLKEHIEDICSASSSRSAFISKPLWGSELTLLMMTKLLQRPIYVVIGAKGLQKPTYQIYKPVHKTTVKYALESGGEFNYSSDDVRTWMTLLQQDCVGLDGSGKLPIVMLFGRLHYTWLQFGEAPTDEMLQRLVPREDEENSADADVIMSSAGELNSDLSVQNDHRFDDDNRGGVTTKEQEERNEVLKHGGLRTKELQAFPTQGPHGIAPGLQKLLVNLDWDNDAEVSYLVDAIGESKPTLVAWQTRLKKEGIVGIETTDDEDVDMDSSESSEWTPEDAKETANKAREKERTNRPARIDPPDGHLGRLTGEGGRHHEKLKRGQWNNFAKDWNRFSELPFPTLPPEKICWKQAVQAHPAEMLAWLQIVDSPEFVLRSLNASIILDWTRQLRIDCLLIGLTELQDGIQQAAAKGIGFDPTAVASLESWISFLTDERQSMSDDGYIHSTDLWSSLNKLKPDKIPLLQDCRKGQADKLSRLLITAYAYLPELARANEQAQAPPTSTAGILEQLVAVLQYNPGIHRAYYSNGSDGDWTALESLLALHHSLSSPGTHEGTRD